jgi:type II secretory ATPase GspE/PulE/Tfp pilus assembly ATPase PilB-like protein
MGIEPFLLASTLEVIIAQRLVRKICNRCRTAISADAALASLPASIRPASLHITRKSTFYSGKGCDACNDTGYQGRSALFELIPVTPEIQELITTSPTAREIATLAHKQGVATMFEDGIEKAKNGVTTLAEVVRVVAPPAKKTA